ncbi:hypothetical protein AB4Y43_16920 [Paraburkholderia sp. BR10872]|uniref:hypothetical protein n=1 Tax=Paraburkholderia sp. BR10872 TaxID=3236989 RepID=UPI0034D335C5
MLSARALRLSLDSGGRIDTISDLPGARDSLAIALGMLEARNGRQWRNQLSNVAPVHVHAPSNTAASLTAVRVSGLPSGIHASPQPVVHHARSITMFLARGDCYQVRMHTRAVIATLFVTLDYGLAPKLSTTAEPLALRSPLDQMPANLNGSRLLEIALDRELAPVEEYVAAVTMPNVWSRFGGGPVRAISAPTDKEIETAHAFCLRLSNPSARIAVLRAQTIGWARAIDNWERQRLQSPAPVSTGHVQDVVEGYAAPVSEENDKQDKQPKANVESRSLADLQDAASPPGDSAPLKRAEDSRSDRRPFAKNPHSRAADQVSTSQNGKTHTRRPPRMRA